jgi:hypothetical protein
MTLHGFADQESPFRSLPVLTADFLSSGALSAAPEQFSVSSPRGKFVSGLCRRAAQ